MKSIKFLSACALMAFVFSSNALAQQQNDSTVVYNNLVSRTNGIWNLNFLSLSTDDFAQDQDDSIDFFYTTRSPHSMHYADFGIQDLYLAYAGLGNAEGFEQQIAHSLEFGMNIGRIQHWNALRTVGFQTTLGLSWNRYNTKDNAVFQLDQNGDMFCGPWEAAPKPYKRARLTYVSWRVPVMLQFQDRNRQNCLSVGVEGELRHHVRSRVRMGGKKRYDVLRHGMDVNPWGLNLIARYDFGDFGIFGRYSMTSFFDDKQTKFDGTPFAFGFILRLDD